MRYVRFAICIDLVSLAFMLSAAVAADPAASAAASPGDTIDLFAAKNAGQVNVRLIPHDEKSGHVLITNNTTGPLTIKLPAAFAGTPILAQFRGGGLGPGPGAGFGTGPGGGGTQAVAGGFGPPGGANAGAVRGGNINGGVPFFNIGPDRAVKLKFVSVCLEHGKPEPNSRIPYDLVPIDSYTNDPAVIQLAQMLGRGEIDQSAAQAAAWHLANGLTWQQLNSRIGVRHINGVTEPFFSPQALHNAERVVEEVNRRARLSDPVDSSPGATLASYPDGQRPRLGPAAYPILERMNSR
jgi:hypothetical protein